MIQLCCFTICFFPVGGTIGLVHLLASILALIFGTLVLVKKKGTRMHVKMGYLYVAGMLVLNVTAFMLYRLFNGFGVFHVAAIGSFLTVAFGMVPIWTKKPVGKWRSFHFSFMYWSVIGLYAAFASEVLTRIPEQPFFEMVGIATGVVMLLGGIVFAWNKKKWADLINP